MTEIDKLDKNFNNMKTILDFILYVEERKISLYRNSPGNICPERIIEPDLGRLIHQYFGIDIAKLDIERKALLQQTTEEDSE